MPRMYCPKCNSVVDANPYETFDRISVKGTEISAMQSHAVCPHCGDEIATEDMSRRNLDNAYSAYRAKEGLLTPAQIHSAYESYGLSQASFAKLLGLGAATISRYENGALQTRSIDRQIRDAISPDHMLDLLSKHGGEIPLRQKETAERQAVAKKQNSRGKSRQEYGVIRFSNLFVGLFDNSEPSINNGFKAPSLEAIGEMARYFASRIPRLGRIRLNKAFFYSDFGYFAAEGRSLSGLEYARAPMGPIIDGYEPLFAALVKRGYLEVREEDANGYEMEALYAVQDANTEILGKDALRIMDNVILLLKQFGTASALSGYTHSESFWRELPDGAPIPYDQAFRLNDIDRISDIGQ